MASFPFPPGRTQVRSTPMRMSAAARPRTWFGRGLLAFLLVLALLGVDFIDRRPRLAPRDAASEQTTPERSPAEPSGPVLELRRTHLAQLGATRWHQAGTRGQGVKIAVLDSGLRGYRAFLGRGLPLHPLVKSFRKDRNLEARDSQHGILCAEILHAVAPDAELLLANWESDQPESFLEAMQWARSHGARIISCSLIMPSWSDSEGGGPVHVALADLLGGGDRPSDVLFFASAGNIAQRHWHGAFQPDSQGLHQWSVKPTDGTPSENQSPNLNRVTPWGNERVAVELYGNLRGGYELHVCDSKTGKAVDHSRVRRATGSTREWGTAVVRFDPDADASYDVSVRAVEPIAQDENDTFHLVVLGGTLEHATRQGSIPFPGDGARVEAVGAVDTEGERLFYSSCGPNSKLPKPDLVAAVPFPSVCRPQPFAGTSAAAPQAAALAALWWSRHPDWTANQVREALHRHARDLGPPGHDFETGYGLIRLP